MSSPSIRQMRVRQGRPPRTSSAAVRSPAVRWRPSVLGHDPEADGRVAPHLREIGSHRFYALVVEPVDTAGPARLVSHQACLFQEPQGTRYSRPADRQGVSDLADGPAACSQQLYDGAPVWVPKGVERITVEFAPRHEPRW